MRKTKIVCTMGPATEDDKVLRELMRSGMAVARFNFSHGDHEMHKKTLERVVRLREELDLPIATMLDTKGPEIRLGSFKNGKVLLKKGTAFTLRASPMEGDETQASISFPDLAGDVQEGSTILLDDGLIELTVRGIRGGDIVCRVQNDGFISNNKGVNVPNVHLSMPFISERDREDIIFGIQNGFDFIAASFVRTAADVLEIRKIFDEFDCHGVNIIAKIENQEGVENIDQILRVSDGIMVARGDMGVEIPLEDVPVLQKMIIKKVYNAGKQVITATQMLESMIKNPRPTRAEATDVANAIYDGTSAIMLSGETAAGQYPVEAVRTMARIAERTEQDIDYIKRFKLREVETNPDVTTAISHATCTTAHDLGAAAIITVTKSGMITDSQVFKKVSKDTPADVPLTSFSILMARYKGNLEQAVRGVTELDRLKDGDVVLISEGCTHHRQCEDIGTVKIPRWIREYTGKEIQIETTSGTEFPDDLSKYKLIIHCGGCMLNEREMKYRYSCAADQGIPITNYGIMIAYVNGILKRSVELFPELYEIL